MRSKVSKPGAVAVAALPSVVAISCRPERAKECTGAGRLRMSVARGASGSVRSKLSSEVPMATHAQRPSVATATRSTGREKGEGSMI